MHVGFFVFQRGQSFNAINGIVDRVRRMFVEVFFQGSRMGFECRSGWYIIIAFESFQPFGEKEFDVGKESVSSDTEVFANDCALDILGYEENTVQFFADAWIGTSGCLFANRFEVGWGEGNSVHEYTSTNEREKRRITKFPIQKKSNFRADKV